MLTHERMLHILGVARTAYRFAKSQGNDEDFCRKMFMLGFVHDVGYEFDDSNHSETSAHLLALISNKESQQVIANHGKVVDERDISPEHLYLNAADMATDSRGDTVSTEYRLYDISQRYGKDSSEYKTALAVCEQLKLPLEV